MLPRDRRQLPVAPHLRRMRWGANSAWLLSLPEDPSLHPSSPARMQDRAPIGSAGRALRSAALDDSPRSPGATDSGSAEGSSLRIALITSLDDPPENARRAASISYSTQAKAEDFERWSTGSPFHLLLFGDPCSRQFPITHAVPAVRRLRGGGRPVFHVPEALAAAPLWPSRNPESWRARHHWLKARSP